MAEENEILALHTEVCKALAHPKWLEIIDFEHLHRQEAPVTGVKARRSANKSKPSVR